MAVSSSVPALKAGNLFPDLVISTDGGNWANFHLYDLFRAGSGGRCGNAFPLAAALSAALPSQCSRFPILPISDGSLWQTLVLKELGLPFMILPQRGTVSASAVDLAFALTKGDVYVAGIDLASRDIRSHSRPYSLDRFLEEKEGRLNPVYSQSYSRSAMLKAGGSFDIYASWFEKQLASYPKRLHPLGKNNPVFGASENMAAKKAASAAPCAAADFKTAGALIDDSAPHKALKLHPPALLEKALKDGGEALSEKLHAELSSLLFPGTAAPARQELLETLRSAGRRDRGSLQHG